MASSSLPHPLSTPWVLDFTFLFAIPQSRSTFPPTLTPHRPYNRLPEGHLDQGTQQTSPQMPEVLRHRLQGHPLSDKWTAKNWATASSAAGSKQRFTQNAFHFRCFALPLPAWEAADPPFLLPPSPPKEMVSPAWRRGRQGVTWAGARTRHLGRREGEAWAAVGPVGRASGGGAARLAPARERAAAQAAVPAGGSFDLGRWQRAADPLRRIQMPAEILFCLRVLKAQGQRVHCLPLDYLCREEKKSGTAPFLRV